MRHRTRWYGAAGLVLAAGLAVATGALVDRAGDGVVTRSVEQTASLAAGSAVAPLLTPALAEHDPQAQNALGRAADELAAAGVVSHVTVRAADGRVVWSDDPAAIGTTSPLTTGERTALRTGSVQPVDEELGVPAGSRAVAVGVPDTSDTSEVVDIVDDAAVVAALRPAWANGAAVTMAALLFLLVVQAPLAYGLARRATHRHSDDAVAEVAADAADGERRRLASEVHDYVIPALTGLAYDLDGARLGSPRSDPPVVLFARSADGLRRVVGDLRGLLSDGLPARFPQTELGTALGVLGKGSVAVRVHCPRMHELPEPVAETLYRCAQESLRNAAAHSRAEAVEIVVERDDEQATMIIDDDGCGFEVSELTDREAAGHMGLRSLGALVADRGGSLTVRSAPGQGTRLVVTLPMAPAPRRELVR
jgi:two-component system NarL family sensor kinase